MCSNMNISTKMPGDFITNFHKLNLCGVVCTAITGGIRHPLASCGIDYAFNEGLAGPEAETFEEIANADSIQLSTSPT